MKVFKFGGASVRDGQAVKNMCKITRDQGEAPLIIVVSAMGKSTNALETLVLKANVRSDYEEELRDFREFHQQICMDLFAQKEHPVYTELQQWYGKLEAQLENCDRSIDALYDSIVSYGELISTSIIYHYLKGQLDNCQFLDARELVITNQRFREAQVQWDITTERINQAVAQHPKIFITQGFIGSDGKGHTTTLGREGSDFTAAIFAYCLQAQSVTIWKDVPGIMNADPNRWDNTIKYPLLSYAEAAEMTYYGASVIHPKTIRPLAIKSIPLVVKSFIDPVVDGTRIGDVEHPALEPAIIFKGNQCLISFQVRDFTFINERKLSMIFHLFEEYNIKINMMQSSAISFSVCVDSPDRKMKVLINSLSAEFDILYNDHLELVTVKNYQQELVTQIKQGRQILLEQKSRKNYQMVTTTEYTGILA